MANLKQYLGYILAALASVPVYGMALADHNAFHNILTEMQDGEKIKGYYRLYALNFIFRGLERT